MEVTDLEYIANGDRLIIKPSPKSVWEFLPGGIVHRREGYFVSIREKPNVLIAYEQLQLD